MGDEKRGGGEHGERRTCIGSTNLRVGKTVLNPDIEVRFCALLFCPNAVNRQRHSCHFE